MEALEQLMMGFSIALTPINIFFCFAGALLGTIIGAMPGIGPSAGVAILMPLTFGMNPTSAIIMLAGIYYGAMYGGTITSVLINVPGESASVMTTLDGYQMAKKGRAGAALGMAAIGSFVAGTTGVVLLMLVALPLVRVALAFGPPEYFGLMLMGLATISGLTGNSALKGMAMAILGLLISSAGLDAFSGHPRLVFDQTELLDGVSFLVVAVGVFGVGEVLYNVERTLKLEFVTTKITDVWPTLQDWKDCWATIIRSTIIGFVIGVLPGAGGTVAGFLTYATEKKLSKQPESFGTGNIVGVAAPESANNAASAGAMVPLLTLGIPGSGTTAVLLGALIMYGLQPGPLLFQKNPDFVWGLIASMYVGNVMLVILNIAFIPVFVQILKVPYYLLMPLIIVFSTVGIYAVDNSMFDVAVMYVFGIIGYIMRKFELPPAPMVLAVVLGPMLERALRQSLTMSLGSYDIFFTRPISAGLTTVAILMLVSPIVTWTIRTYRKRQAAKMAP